MRNECLPSEGFVEGVSERLADAYGVQQSANMPTPLHDTGGGGMKANLGV